jgi:hypothetical protein
VEHGDLFHEVSVIATYKAWHSSRGCVNSAEELRVPHSIW